MISTTNTAIKQNLPTNPLSSHSFEHNLATKTLIIFDWDGTLMDSIGLIVETMHIAGEAHGFSTTDQAVKSIIGLSLMNGIETLYPQATAIEQQAIHKSYVDYYVPNSQRTPFFKSIEQLLQSLKNQGKELAVATGKNRQGLDRVLKVSNSEHYFVITRCTDESGSKPDPQMLKDILNVTQKSIAEAVYIGDSIFDIQMANALGMTSIAVSYGAATAIELAAQQPTYQANTPSDLANLLSATS